MLGKPSASCSTNNTKTRLSKADIFLTRRPENEKTNQTSFQFWKPRGKVGSRMAVPALASPRTVPGCLSSAAELSVLRNHRVTEQALGTHTEAMKGRSRGRGIAQWVRCLLHKHENLSSEPLVSKAGCGVCNPDAGMWIQVDTVAPASPSSHAVCARLGEESRSQ